jgi:hypothetical protein
MKDKIKTRKKMLYFVVFGSVTGQTGTPIRIRRWIQAGEKNKFPLKVLTYDNFKEFEIINYLENNLRDGDTIFTFNHIGVYKLRKMLNNSKINIVVDIHGLQSVEMQKISVLKFKFLLMEILTNFYMLSNRITVVSVSNSILKRNLLNTKSVGSFVVPGGLRKVPKIKVSSIKLNPGYKYISYIGNDRSYQGYKYLESVITNSNIYKKNKVALVSLIHGELTIQKNLDLPITYKVNSRIVDWLMIKSDVLVVPRLESTISRYSFPSKIFDYISSGTPVVVSSAVEDLPDDLERIIFRFNINDQSDLLTQITKTLSNSKFLKTKNLSLIKSLYKEYNWDKLLINILDRKV